MRAPGEVKNFVTEWTSIFAMSRALVVRDDEIVQGILRADLTLDDVEVREALDGWGGTHFVYPTADGTEITLVRPLGPRPRERWWIHILLGLSTFLTTTAAGAYFVGRNPFDLALVPAGPLGIPIPTRVFPTELLPGVAFSVPLLAILLGVALVNLADLQHTPRRSAARK